MKELDLVLIIDRSGSMEGTEDNIIIGHQILVESLKRTGKNIILTTILFDDDIVIACDGKRLDKVEKLDYIPDNCTALYDAWGSAIIHENKRKEDPKNPYPNADVLYLTVTDGGENSSKMFTMEKIKELMVKERERSSEGKGVREFATINEFGIDVEEFEREIKLGKNNSQIFYRGDAGIEVLFKIIECAAENMVQNRRITEQWIRQTDELKIGSYTLGKLKEITKDAKKTLVDVEKQCMELFKLADGGLTQEFLAVFKKYSDMMKKINLQTGDAEVDAILMLYTCKNDADLNLALRRAVDTTINKRAVESAVCLGKIRMLADDKQAAPKDFLAAIKAYNDSVVNLDFAPAYSEKLISKKTPNEIKYIIAQQEERYKTIIAEAFKLRTSLLKEAFGEEKRQTFQSLSEFTQEPFTFLFKAFPEYSEFCHWFQTLSREIKK
jgi:hypothetical protein